MEIYEVPDKSHFSPIHTILFDLDGTLLDSRDIIIEAAYETVQHYQPNRITYEDLLLHFGMDLGNYLSNTLIEKEEAKLFFTKEKSKKYMYSPLFPKVKDGLQQLKEQKFQLGIVTNQQTELVGKVLQLQGIAHYFDIVITKESVINAKPSPEPVQLAVEKLSAEKEHTIMVGDTLFDLHAAQSAGITCLLLDYYGHAESTNMFQQLLDYLIPNTVG